MLTGLGCGIINAQTDEPIVLRPNNTGSEATANTSGQNGPQRSPIYIPTIYYSNHTLLFEECCIGCEIEIMENDEVVYSTIITDANGTVQLPEDLSGNFELCLYWSSFAFVGEFELLPY
ncbi:MAG: hypothetical protein Q4A15_08675 [Prevotellaceae bacterium]|nr:hypothetical protein [Prevotellaceae bacterium]